MGAPHTARELPVMKRGTTLLEALTVLTLVAIMIGVAGPSARRLRDRVAVVSTRETLVGLIAEARMLAIARGGATVRIGRVPPSGAVVVDGEMVLEVSESIPRSVELDLGPGRDSVRLRYDALGIGRVASTTIRARAGAEERTVVVSSFGRVRRR